MRERRKDIENKKIGRGKEKKEERSSKRGDKKENGRRKMSKESG